MKAELTATIEGGVLKLDAALPFPDHTRVKLTIEAVEPENRAAACDCPPLSPIQLIPRQPAAQQNRIPLAVDLAATEQSRQRP